MVFFPWILFFFSLFTCDWNWMMLFFLSLLLLRSLCRRRLKIIAAYICRLILCRSILNFVRSTQLPVVRKDYPWMNIQHGQNIRQVFWCCVLVRSACIHNPFLFLFYLYYSDEWFFSCLTLATHYHRRLMYIMEKTRILLICLSDMLIAISFQ